MTRLVMMLWMASGAVFVLGVFLLAQSNLGPQDTRAARQDAMLAAAPRVNESAVARAPVTHETAWQPVLAENDVQQANGQPPLPPKRPDQPARWTQVSGTDAVLRASPDEAAAMIAGFPVGYRLSLLSEQGGWAKVEEPKSRTVGWMQVSQLDGNGSPVASTGRSGSRIAMAESSDDMNAPAVHDRRVARRNGPIANLLRALGGR
ncbi:SH3 domain-containing protein [Methyloligella sp. 2.7D]|uniref:SH3 domain-containing protein n=1 Tax=unclassified Methyloligella TaxID=2625955 RepID=UPI00157C36E9|nr:SH3 domain-containing protein [Methyloligella sp. GL2]QKP76805.1 SH3 domain-containing protein [Methyloligella sp. GL2]